MNLPNKIEARHALIKALLIQLERLTRKGGRVRRSSQANSDPAILGGLFLSGCGGGTFRWLVTVQKVGINLHLLFFF
jgi:hypothetical protein